MFVSSVAKITAKLWHPHPAHLRAVGPSVPRDWVTPRQSIPCPYGKTLFYTTPFEENKQSFVFKLAKNCMPNIIKSMQHYENWSIWRCLVCCFLPILKGHFCLYSSRALTTYLILHRCMDQNRPPNWPKIFLLYAKR